MDRSSENRLSVAAGAADANTMTSNRGFARKGVRVGIFSAAFIAIVGAAGVSYASPHLFKTSKPAAVTPAATTTPPGAEPATTPASAVASVPAVSPSVVAPSAEVPAPVAAQAPAGEPPAQSRPGAGSNGQRRSSQNGQSYTWSGPEESTGNQGSSEDLSDTSSQVPSGGSGMQPDWDAINKANEEAAKRHFDEAAKNFDPSQTCTNCGG